MDMMFAPFRKYAEFEGRAGRAEFWQYCLFIFIVNCIFRFAAGRMGADFTGMGMALAGGGGVNPAMMFTGPAGPVLGLSSLFSLATLVPSIAVSFRRLHDTNRSAWWLLLWLIPVFGWLVLLIFYLSAGTPGENRFGPAPSQAPAAA